MKKEAKTKVVEQLAEMFNKSGLVILFDYKGMTVPQMNDLRRSMEKETEADLVVVKNTLAHLGVQDTPYKGMADSFKGPNAALFVYGDAVAASKVLVKHAKDVEALKVSMGMLNGSLLSEAQIQALAKLPSRDELLSILLGTLQAPASNFVGLLANIPRGLLNCLNGIKEQKESQAA